MKNARKSPWRLLYKFHRYSGLAVAVIAIFLALTGIALNHTEDLQLDSQFVKSPALLNWYGIEGDTKVVAYRINDHWLSQRSEQFYFDDQPLFKSDSPLKGVIATEDFIVVAHQQRLTLLTLQGEIIEKIDQKLPIQAIGMSADSHINIKSNNRITYSDDGLLSWQADNGDAIEWSKAVNLPADLDQQLQQISRQKILPYERVMLDLHSGRLFGKAGVFIVDLSGIILILLAISGSWIWLRHKLKSRLHKTRHTPR